MLLPPLFKDILDSCLLAFRQKADNKSCCDEAEARKGVADTIDLVGECDAPPEQDELSN